VRKTLVLAALPVIAIAVAWLRLEQPARLTEGLAVCMLGLAPVLGGPLWSRIAASGLAVLLAVWLAFGPAPWDVLPWVDADWLDPLGTAIDRGLLDFYDRSLPFDPAARPEMHALVLAALFAAELMVVAALAAGRTLLAAILLVAGAGWPATLVEGRAELAVGALLLTAALWVVVLARGRPPRALLPGLAAGAVLVALGAAASTSGAISKEGVLAWRDWKLYRVPGTPVGVRYVWDANYGGIAFPETQTTVLRIKAPRRALYWRASTLDTFTGDRWIEDLYPAGATPAIGSVIRNAQLPPRAANERAWVRQEVSVEAFDDDHVVAAATPMRIESDSMERLFAFDNGGVKVLHGLRRGQRYTVSSYAPRPVPAELRRSRAVYPADVARYLRIGRAGGVPVFGERGRKRVVESYFSDDRYQALWAYRAVWREAGRLTARAKSPYEATLAIERWLRTDGSFRYEEKPAVALGTPPLVDFVVRGRAGYCQHFAGTMALMLRFLGIPARVAVGFTAGTWKGGVWTVTDHQAHAWVEAWFDGWGWLTFDPTPGRGTISAAYTWASDSADAIFELGGRRILEQGRLPGVRTDLGPAAPNAERGRDPWPLLGPVIALVAAVVGLGLVKVARRRARYLGRDPRRRASAARAELADWLRDQGIDVTSQTTLRELAATLESALGVSGRAFAAAVGRARYGPPERAAEAAADARRELRLLLRALRARLNPRRRLRGYLAVRSLRKA
jgi:transglutaminase-like putative cysteine protease